MHTKHLTRLALSAAIAACLLPGLALAQDNTPDAGQQRSQDQGRTQRTPRTSSRWS